MANPNNGSATKGWGSSCSKVLGPGGELTHVLNDDQMPTYSAGYGSVGPPTGWSIDEYGKSYEWAQNNVTTPYSNSMYRRGAKEIAKDCVTYGIPPVFLNVQDQTIQPVPTGLVRHDRCQNGTKLGKSDPGGLFDETLFLGYLKEEIALLQPPEEDMTPEQAAQLAHLYHIFSDGDPQRWAVWDSTLRTIDSNAAQSRAILFDDASNDSPLDKRRLILMRTEIGRIRTLMSESRVVITQADIDRIASATALKFSERLVA
jgi:hypothetical protein